jgi:hypothetical protein
MTSTPPRNQPDLQRRTLRCVVPGFKAAVRRSAPARFWTEADSTAESHAVTKEYRCRLAVSDVLGTVAQVPLGDFPAHEIQVRGPSAPLAIRVIGSAAKLAHYEPPRPHPGNVGVWGKCQREDPPRRKLLELTRKRC